MGFWTGVAQAYRDIDEKRTQDRRIQEERELQQRRIEEERAYQEQLRQEERAFEKEMFERGLRAGLGQTLLQTRIDRAESEVSADEIASYGQTLLGLGIDEELVSKAVSTGDSEALSNLTSTVLSNYERAQSAGYGDQYIQTVNETLQEGEYQPATSQPFDLGGITELLGTDLDPEDMGLSGFEITVPGSMVYQPPIFTEQPTPTDYGKVEKRIANNALSQARSESRRLTEAVSTLQDRLESAETGEEESYLRNLIDSATERLTEVEGAIEAYSGDSKDAFGLLQTYGTSSVDSIMESFPSFDRSTLAPTFQENLGRTGIRVSSEQQIRDLADLGVIRVGDVIFYEPENRYVTIEP